MIVASVLFMVDRIKKRLPCVSVCKGSLLFLKSVVGAVIIFFRHRRHHHGFRRRLSYGCSNLSCGLRSLSYGFRHCSYCPSCGLSLTRSCSCCSCWKTSFSKRRNCFCCSCRSKSLSCCFCYRSRCLSSKKNSLKRTSSADVRIRSWNATGGCCWARCRFDARCFGCPCGHCSNCPDVAG